MKSITTLLIGLGLLAYSVPIKAQDEAKLRKDQTYSTHNYKHSNKAATARSWENKEGVPVWLPSQQDSRLSNYKNQVPGQLPVGGVVCKSHRLTQASRTAHCPGRRPKNAVIQRLANNVNSRAPMTVLKKAAPWYSERGFF